ncbi:MAG: tetratricopeptide repeat protein [Armatimonadota bacterium]|nr:tetratricopeptide repeat protein [Armatimonadota bacterium]
MKLRALLVMGLLVVLPGAWAQQEDFGALLSRAEAVQRGGDQEAAEKLLDQALQAARTDEERAQARWMLSQSREHRGDSQGALSALEPMLQLEADGHWAVRCLQALASLAERMRRPELAARANSRLVEVLEEDDPRAVSAALSLARAERRSGDLQGAVERLRRLLAGDAPTHVEAQARDLLVGMLVQADEFEQALQAARQAQEKQERARLLIRVADGLEEGQEPDRAEAVAWEVLELSPAHPQAMQLIYRIAARRGAVEELRARLEREVSDQPERTLRFLARIAEWEDQPEAALGALERLVETRPDDADLLHELGRLAMEAGKLERAETALRRVLEIAPNDRAPAVTLAEVLVHEGRSDEAVALLKDAVSYDPRQLPSVRSLGNLLERHSLHHQAAEVYRQARKAAGDPALLAFEMARAQIGLLHYEEATGELLRALESQQVAPRIVGYELQRLATDEVAGGEVLEAVDAHVAEAELSDEARVALARVFLAAERAQRAAEMLAGIEAAGMEIAELARDCELRGERDLAARLYAMALQAEPDGPLAAETATRLARIRAERGRWREALEALEDVAGIDQYPEALLLRGRLLLHRARRPDEAREAFRQLIGCAGSEPRYLEAARWGLADWLFAVGRLDEAEEAYAQLAGAKGEAEQLDMPPAPPGVTLPGLPMPVLMEEEPGPGPAYAALRMAEIALRRGDLEEAEERFRLVVSAYSDSDHANDALQRLAFIQENLDGEGRAEEQYLQALGMIERGEGEAAEMLLAEVAGTRGEPLADDAQMLLGRARAERAEYEAAVRAWMRLADGFPESLLAPQALLRAAGVLRGELGDAAAAADALQRVVDAHPESAAADQARAELELLPRATAPGADAGAVEDS